MNTKETNIKITREPIRLSQDAIAVIHIFTQDKFLDYWMLDSDNYCKELTELYKKAAKQFTEQLSEYWTPAFMKALKTEIENCLEI